MKKAEGKGEKIKDYFLQMLNQFIPVILGVYLGIVASNWNNERVQIAEQKEFVQNLYLEMQANKAKIEESLAYRKAIFLSAKKARQSLEKEILEAQFWSVGHWKHLPGWEGVKISTLENSVYHTGIMTNALSGLDFKIINSIARSYNHQEDYKTWAQRYILDHLEQMPDEIKTFDALKKIEAWYDVIGKEEELISQYQQTLEDLKTLYHE